MKKLYLTKKFIQHNSNRSKKAMRKLHKKKRCHSVLASTAAKTEIQKEQLSAPSIFSMVENPDASVKFLVEISKKLDKNIKVHLNLESVEKITVESILYILLLLKRVEKIRKTNKTEVSLSGTAPKIGTLAYKIFMESGFYDHVNSPYNLKKHDKNESILTVKHGIEVDTNVVEEIIKFISSKGYEIKRNQQSAIYNTIVECMANTNEHASKSGDDKKNWWLMAISGEDKIHFAFLDDGLGIAKTVRRRGCFEKFKKDPEILKLAVTGDESRSRTGDETRNQGLPEIRTYLGDRLISDLVFIANKGYYAADQNDCRSLRSQMQGSIISWNFIKIGNKENDRK